MRNKITICSSLEEQPNGNIENIWDAINNKNWSLVEELVKNGADIYINKYNQHDHGVSMLCKIISNNQWEIAEYLIDHSQINYMNIYSSFNNNNPLWELARKNRWRLAKKFISQATSDNNMPYEYCNIGNFVIWMAAKAQKWGWIEELAERFMNVKFYENIIGFTKESALSICINQRQWGVVSELLKYANRNNKIKTIEQLSKVANIEPIVIRIIINNLFNIPEYSFKQLSCEPQTSHDINDTEVNEFYARLDGYSRCKDINTTFRKKSDNSYKEKMYGKFYKEMYFLMEKFAEISPPEIGKLNFRTFARLFDNPSHFHNDKKIFYITMKDALEEIYYIVANNLITKHQIKRVLTDLARQLVVCGPGIFNSIIYIRQNLATGDIKFWLSKYRQKIVLDAAAEFLIDISEEFASPEEMAIHVDALFLMEATRLNFAPLGGEQQLKHGDIFSGGIEEKSKVRKKINQAFKNDYQLDKVIIKIKTQFAQEIQSLISSNDIVTDKSWIKHSDYLKINDQILRLASVYGLVNIDNEFYLGFFDFSDDWLHIRIREEVIDYYFMQTIDNLSIKNIKSDQQNNIIYCLEYGCILIWEQEKTGKIIPCADKLKALEQIYEQTNDLMALIAYLTIILQPNIHKKEFIENLINLADTNKEFDPKKTFMQMKILSHDLVNSTPYSSYYPVCRA